MPIVAANGAWVKVPPKPRKVSSKPPDPVGFLRGPLAYITGRPEFAEPVKKRPTDALIPYTPMAHQPKPYMIDAEPRKPKHRAVSGPATSKGKHKTRSEYYEEADEEIHRPDLDDVQSRRSASPIGTRHNRAAPSIRSRRHETSRPEKSGYEVEDDTRSRRSRRPPSVYDEEVAYYKSHRSPSHHRERQRDRDRYHGRAYSEHYGAPSMPHIQPIVIYSTPPAMQGCGGHHGCNHGHVQYQYSAPSRPMLEAIPREPAGLPAPKPAPSVVSSKSSRSEMSYKWYSATQPLKM